MTEPVIEFSAPDTEPNVFIENKMSVSLWSEDAQVDPWVVWAIDTETTDVNTNQQIDGYLYSGYAIQIDCDFSSASTLDGSGCCIRDDSEQEGGGYCVRYDEETEAMKTYYLTHAQFLAAIEEPYEIEDVLLVGDDAENDVKFEIFECTDPTGVHMSVCNKLQMRPAASYSKGFRFESGNWVWGYFYDMGLGDRSRWNDVLLQLTGSSFNYSVAASLVAVSLLTTF